MAQKKRRNGITCVAKDKNASFSASLHACIKEDESAFLCKSTPACVAIEKNASSFTSTHACISKDMNAFPCISTPAYVAKDENASF